MANPSNSPRHGGSGTHHGRHKTARRGGAGGSGGGGDHSPRDHQERGAGGWDHGGGGGGRGGQRSHHNNGGRRGGGNGGPGGPGGGGVPHHGGFGGRRRGGFDGGFFRGPGMGMGPYMRGAPPPPPPLAVAPPFMGHPPPGSHMRAFAGPMMAFHDMPSPVSPVSPMYYVGPPPLPEALRGMAFAPHMVGPPAYPYFQPPAEPEPEPEPELEPEPVAEPDSEARQKLQNQFEFYFSKDNLCGDVYLRQHMDEEGFVSVPFMSTFNKVRGITADIPNANLQYIIETIQSSSILEVKGDKVRRKDDWDKWLIPKESNPNIPSSSAAAVPGPSTNVNDLTAQLGGVGLQEAAGPSSTVGQNHHEVVQNGGSASSNNPAPAAEESAGQR